VRSAERRKRKSDSLILSLHTVALKVRARGWWRRPTALAATCCFQLVPREALRVSLFAHLQGAPTGLFAICYISLFTLPPQKRQCASAISPSANEPLCLVRFFLFFFASNDQLAIIIARVYTVNTLNLLCYKWGKLLFSISSHYYDLKFCAFASINI
jgi:hypothetical protein